MLLRASSEALGDEAKLSAAVGEGDGGVEHGELLARFAESATRGSDDLPSLREQLVTAMGGERFIEVAATVGIFNGLVRVADATGIPLDDGTLKASIDFREQLGLNQFAGATNTDLARAGAGQPEREVAKLFR